MEIPSLLCPALLSTSPRRSPLAALPAGHPQLAGQSRRGGGQPAEPRPVQGQIEPSHRLGGHHAPDHRDQGPEPEPSAGDRPADAPCCQSSCPAFRTVQFANPARQLDRAAFSSEIWLIHLASRPPRVFSVRLKTPPSPHSPATNQLPLSLDRTPWLPLKSPRVRQRRGAGTQAFYPILSLLQCLSFSLSHKSTHTPPETFTD